MRPLRTRLEEARRELGVQWDVLERDYLLFWILAGMGEVPALRDTLVLEPRAQTCSDPGLRGIKAVLPLPPAVRSGEALTPGCRE